MQNFCSAYPQGKIIATLGDGRVEITLKLIEQPRLELVSTMTFRGASVELARELAEDEDEAISIATDLEWKAQDELKVLDVDFTKNPCGWPEALERHFDFARAQALRVAVRAAE
ncbi:hypothetical protein JL101_036450 (plasmid) [Skermanella rosea]|uniref:hypothetical protein n=1 Tax=Skermanella rosea TaxID=1817965 RepID=UPI0019324CB8|nr:hypothetical protein [Skermanella rosea]UEM08235.1 hypothetical protein JL101_036450 [Skermanella rosea]